MQSNITQALRAYREGTLSREKLLSEVERELAEREIDAVSLLRLLNEEHARARLPDNLHGTIAARILHWRDPPPPFKPLAPKIPVAGHCPSPADELGAIARARVIDNEAIVISGPGSLPPEPPGEPLQRRLLAPDFKGMPAWEADRIVASIVAALELAHRNGVIHGDLKPGNIIITGKGEVKVVDFSTAPLMTRPRPALAALTRLYASPEMLAQHRPEPRDDIYALACIAHEILTGLHPFDERSALDARDADLVLERRKGMTRCQYRAIAHGLEFDRERRTPSASRFLEEFRGRRSRPVGRMLLLAAAVALILLATVYFALRLLGAGGLVRPE